MISAIAFACMSSAAFAGTLEPITAPQLKLKARVSITSDLVTLGDLFENAGKVAKTAVFRSPALGKSGVLNVRRIMAAAREHGLDWSNPDVLENIVVTRASNTIGLSDIALRIKEEITQNNVLQFSQAHLKVYLHAKATPFIIRADVNTDMDIQRVRYNPRSGSFSAVVVIAKDTAHARRKTYVGRAVEVVEVPVLTQEVSRGEVIRSHHLKTKEIPARRLTRQTLSETSDVIGTAARKSLQPNRIIRTSDVEKPRVVRKNTLISVIYKLNKLQIISRALALEDGAIGDTVQVLNQRSRRTIQAVVTGPNSVTASVKGLSKTALLSR